MEYNLYMNGNIKKIQITKEKALEMSADGFLNWYLRGRKAEIIDDGTKNHMKTILKGLQKSEIGELVSFTYLDTTKFKPIYSNIHKKASNAPATSVDIITKKNDLYYFTEVKTPTSPNHKNINRNINGAIDDINGRRLDINTAISWTSLNIPNSELIESLWGGIVCLVTGHKDALDDYRDKKYLTFIIFIKDFKDIGKEDINKKSLEMLNE